MSLDIASPFFPLLIGLVALVYSSVGHGGASGYLAFLTMTALSARQASAMALILNLLVATLAFLAFRQAQKFSWRLTWPFLLGAAPLVLVGSKVKLSEQAYFTLVGVVLVWAGLRLILARETPKSEDFEDPPKPIVGAGVGTGIGLLSGLVGVGGGIFLSPVVVLARWADAKRTSATSALFIVSNSALGLAVRAGEGLSLPPNAPVICVAGVTGALAGSYFGSRKIPTPWLRRLLGAVLLTAAVKLLMK